MRKPGLDSVITLPEYVVLVRFEDGPRLNVSFDRNEPFFVEVARRWNERPGGQENPRSWLLEAMEVGNDPSPESKEIFFTELFHSAAEAIRISSHVSNQETASLEHMAVRHLEVFHSPSKQV